LSYLSKSRYKAGVKTHHAGALALVGWYLIGPPQNFPENSNRRFRLDLNAPLAQWEIQKSFDTAAQCERQKQNDYRDAITTLTKPKEKRLADIVFGKVLPRDESEITAGRVFFGELNEKCLASDDPRLKEK